MQRVTILFSLALMFLVMTTATFAQTNVGDNRATNHLFAQLADGRFPDGTSYRSALMVSSDNVAATCTWKFYGVTLAGIGDGTTRTVQLEKYTVFRILTSGTQPFQAGYTTLTCDTPVTAQVLYRYISSSGVVLSEATVFSSPPSTYGQLFLDVVPGSQLGVAIVNNSDVAKTFTVAVTDTLTTTVQIPPRSQIAKFVNELIPALPTTFFGTVLIYSNGNDVNDVYTIGLRYTGPAFTTIPASSVTF